jgi:hypothetical protein
MYKNYCKKCNSVDLFTEVKGNNTGLYCSKCGAWQQWMSKDDIRSFEHKLEMKNQLSKMRECTPEENESIENYLQSIYKNTGINLLHDKTIVERLKEFVEFLNKTIDEEMTKMPLSNEDAIRKNSYCLALERDKNAIINILNGNDFNYVESD